jgi:hypothetical protein
MHLFAGAVIMHPFPLLPQFTPSLQTEGQTTRRRPDRKARGAFHEVERFRETE